MQLNAVRTLTVRGQSQGLDKVKSDLDQVSASQQGVAQSATAMASATETSARRQLSAANAFERLMERNDRMIYLQRQLEREMNVVNRAHEQGAIDATRHSQAVDLLQAKYQRLATAEAQARAQITGTTQAMDAQTAAAHRLGAANDNRGVANFNTANVAAQFQDIGVTAAMGQSPLTIALQQGTQLSAVLGQQGLTGVVKTLGAAFLSIVNPVSLITIGVVGLAAAGIQAFMNMQHSAEDSTDALEKHKEWLDKILAGYDDAAEAADKAREAAVNLPQGAAISDLQADLVEQEKARQELQKRIDDTNAELAETAQLAADISSSSQMYSLDDGADYMAALAEGLEALRAIDLSTASTRAELDAATVAAAEMFNEADNPAVKELANDVYTLAKELRAATGEADATYAALVKLQSMSSINIAVNVGLEGYEDALENLKSLAPDLRTPRERAGDELNTGLAAASAVPGGGEGLRKLLYEQHAATIAALDLKDAQEAAARAATAGDNAAKQQADAYDNLVKSIDDRIAEAEFELTLMGKTADEAARLRIEFELMQQAKDAGVTIDPATMSSYVDRLADAEKKVRDTNKALADQKQIMDQLASSAQTVAGSLMSATGVSDTPIGGAVNGALGSLMKGDWIGALIGGITGLVTGFIEQEQERQEAIKAANDNEASIDAFIAQGFGEEVDEMSVAVQQFKLQAAEYIELAEAAGDKALVRQLKEAAAAYKDTYKAQAANDDFLDLQNDLLDIYEEQRDSIEATIDSLRDYIAANDNFKNSLLVDETYSTLSPQQMLLETQKQFELLVSKAQAGDTNAMNQIQSGATSYLDAAQNYYGSTSAYSDIFDQVQNALSAVSSSATTQLTDAQQQLDATNQTITAIGGVDNSVKTVASILSQLSALQAEISKVRGAEAKELKQEIKALKNIIKNSALAKAA